MPLNLINALSEGNEISKWEIDLEEYFKLIDELAQIEPEMVTLGTFRALSPLVHFINDPLLKKLISVLNKDGKRFRFPYRHRYYIYKCLGEYIQHCFGCSIAICKDPTIHLPFWAFNDPCQCTEI